MHAPQANLSSEARVPTKVPARYLGQLCKHFQHKLPVTFEGGHGRIAFSAGLCEPQAIEDADTLVMSVTASDEASLKSLEDVVARHLERFAFRDETKVSWTRTA